MLVLGRKRGERLAIDTANGRVWVSVVACTEGSKVRIGVDAPADVTVTREELISEVRQEAGDGSPLA